MPDLTSVIRDGLRAERGRLETARAKAIRKVEEAQREVTRLGGQMYEIDAKLDELNRG